MSARVALVAAGIAMALAGVWLGAPMVRAGAVPVAHAPGPLSAGHHTFESACGACHVPFQGVPNEACLRCHGPGLQASEDTHPESKFVDPRNAERVAGLDARACVTCHREHVPSRTRAGVTLPVDFCAACHDDVARERPSHAGFSFAGCAAAGCHHFHDNRALYEGFLARHLGEPENRATMLLPARTPTPPSGAPLGEADADAPEGARPEAAVRDWARTAHARAGVNCTACHTVRAESGAMEWRDHPGGASCGACHGGEQAGFHRGVHGARAALELGPLTPALARLPMRAEAKDRPVDCEACHGAHAYDTTLAAVDACLRCHDDGHSRACASTRHSRARALEIGGAAPRGSGVGCATCHMPRALRRVSGADEVHATHDVSADLRPREKMVRAACLGCHGLGFAIDALADAALVGRCFNGRPTAHVPSLDMVERRGGKR